MSGIIDVMSRRRAERLVELVLASTQTELANLVLNLEEEIARKDRKIAMLKASCTALRQGTKIAIERLKAG